MTITKRELLLQTLHNLTDLSIATYDDAEDLAQAPNLQAGLAVRALMLVGTADMVLRLTVCTLREDGETWEWIADKLGMTRQAAWQKFHRDCAE